jgi:lipopolysaccharide biosynthesis glycosyltransferase
MDQNYYDHCGRTMLRSYKKYFSNIMPLHVYNEDNFEIKVNSVIPVGWELGDAYEDFQKRHTNDRVKTFSKKGFSVIHAMDNVDADRIIWLDADIVFHAEMPSQLLELIAPDNVLSTHFSVWHEQDGIKYHSCETGFFILNTQHKGYKDFCDTYKDIYHNDKTDGLRRFYDGEIYGKTVELMTAKGYKMLNLNPAFHKTPISRSVISPYLSHYKAGLKDSVNFEKLELEMKDEI